MPKRFIPTREQIVASRWLRPVAHRLHDEHLWHLTRQSVARAVAIGLFFGLLLPIAQFLFAVVCAVLLRANVGLSAAFTLVTNPLTFPPIYWGAHRLGSWLLGVSRPPVSAEEAQREIEHLREGLGWVEGIVQWVLSAGAPLVTGLVVLACTAAVAGYLLVWLCWRPRVSPEAPAGLAPQATFTPPGKRD